MIKPAIRLVLAISIDGRLSMPRGGKTQLGGKGDRRVLEESLSWCDGALMGGGTLRSHKSTCLIHNKNLINERLLNGKSSQPVSLIMSNKYNYPLDWPYFRQPLQRWIISSNYSYKNQSVPDGYEKHIEFTKTISDLLQKLGNAGLSKLVILGGAQIAGIFLKADVIDDIQLTITPKIIGGEFTWIPKNLKDIPLSLSNSNAWKIEHLKVLEDNELSLHYLRNRSK